MSGRCSRYLFVMPCLGLPETAERGVSDTAIEGNVPLDVYELTSFASNGISGLCNVVAASIQLGAVMVSHGGAVVMGTWHLCICKAPA